MDERPLLYDLFSGAGGAAKGYERAGFRVVGIDDAPQPRYAGNGFIRMDVFEFMRRYRNGDYPTAACFHASPPCQRYTAMKTMHNARQHPDLLDATRALLTTLNRPYVIENVPGAPLENPLLLCGTMFGLGAGGAELQRHRLFEANIFMLAPQCQHGARDTIGVYGGHVRNRRRSRIIGVYGEGHRDGRRELDKGVSDFSVEQGRQAMGIDWMTLAELSQAIPPAYTEFVGGQLMMHLEGRAA